MCTVITHPIVPIAIAALFPQGTLPPTLVLIGAICSVVPDLDVIGFKFGIRYGDILGHRGLTHSICFAMVLSAGITAILPPDSRDTVPVTFLFLCLATLSHGILDAMTNGGLGIAFFAPFQNERYFLPWRPIEVSPIGIVGFFSARGLQVILSELRWVWLPSGLLLMLMSILRLYR